MPLHEAGRKSDVYSLKMANQESLDLVHSAERTGLPCQIQENGMKTSILNNLFRGSALRDCHIEGQDSEGILSEESDQPKRKMRKKIKC